MFMGDFKTGELTKKRAFMVYIQTSGEAFGSTKLPGSGAFFRNDNHLQNIFQVFRGV